MCKKVFMVRNLRNGKYARRGSKIEKWTTFEKASVLISKGDANKMLRANKLSDGVDAEILEYKLEKI